MYVVRHVHGFKCLINKAISQMMMVGEEGQEERDRGCFIKLELRMICAGQTAHIKQSIPYRKPSSQSSLLN
jgi:hypothetical protein